MKLIPVLHLTLISRRFPHSILVPLITDGTFGPPLLPPCCTFVYLWRIFCPLDVIDQGFSYNTLGPYTGIHKSVTQNPQLHNGVVSDQIKLMIRI